MKKVLSVIVLVALSIAALAQDTTTTGGGGFSLSPSILLILSLVVGLYEVIIRFIPTVGNYSIIGWIIALIQKVLPNKSTTKEDHP